LQIDLRFFPLEDGKTFHLQTAFYDTVPGGSPRPENWTGLKLGSPLGHAKGGGSIVIEKVAGPFKKTGPQTFVLNLQRGLEVNPKSYTLTFVATHPGDQEYKAAVQQAQMILPAKNTEGEEQTIFFPTIPNQKAGGKKLQLKATSSANVPVSYYVLEGPAEVEEDQLAVTKIPPKAKFPVKVTVVAWQYGLNGMRKLKTAEPVIRTFCIGQKK
jgi:hypothetical protein